MWVENHRGVHICTTISPKDNWNKFHLSTYWIQTIAIKDIIVFCDYVMTFRHGDFMMLITRLIIPHILAPIFSWPIIFSINTRKAGISLITDIVSCITQAVTTIEKIRNE